MPVSHKTAELCQYAGRCDGGERKHHNTSRTMKELFLFMNILNQGQEFMVYLVEFTMIGSLVWKI